MLLRLGQITQKISIHTSAKEVTPCTPSRGIMSVDFNPHFREGSDAQGQYRLQPMNHFNPHFREGSDRYNN